MADYNYKNAETGKLLKSGLVRSDYIGVGGNMNGAGGYAGGSGDALGDFSNMIRNPKNLAYVDLDRTYQFTVWLEGIRCCDRNEFRSEKGKGYRDPFLPVRRISLRQTNLSSINIPLGATMLPIISGASLPVMTLSVLDKDNSEIESDLYDWIHTACVPGFGYVTYPSSQIRRMIVRSYLVTGHRALSYNFGVIPTGEVSLTRSYEENDLKTMQLSLAVVAIDYE